MNFDSFFVILYILVDMVDNKAFDGLIRKNVVIGQTWNIGNLCQNLL